MDAVDAFPEKAHHRSLGICALCALKYDSRLFGIQIFDRDKGQPAGASMAFQHLVLELSAHRHDLFKQLRHTLTVKIIMGQGAYPRQLFFLSGFVKYFFSIFDLIFCHLTADFHALLVQLHQLAVNPVYFIPERRQIHERFLHLYFLLLVLAQFAWNLKFCTYYFHEKIV